MTAHQALFVRLVAQAMDRAHKVAAYAERRYPGWSIEPCVVNDRQLAGMNPCTLPDVRFDLSDDGGPFGSAEASLHATGQRMFDAIAKELDAAEREKTGDLTPAEAAA